MKEREDGLEAGGRMRLQTATTTGRNQNATLETGQRAGSRASANRKTWASTSGRSLEFGKPHDH